MSWKVSCVMDERVKFVAHALEGAESMTAVCARFGISRKTGYKWLARFEQEGVEGLIEQSRAPHCHPWTTPGDIRDAVIAMKRRYPGEGPKKIRALLLQQCPGQCWPATSTIGSILNQAGLVESRPKRQRATPSSQPLCHAAEPNDVWSADFKGWFLTGDGKRCTPLTVSDACSRYFLLCQGLTGATDHTVVRPCFERLFRQYGLPRALRTDNGPPFASTGLGGLTPLAVWLMSLGITLERIQPGHPEQNGRHERLHRTLAKATLNPPERNARAQQKAFDDYLAYYNHVRPHEALGQAPPAQRFTPSLRVFPRKLPRMPTYPQHWEVRKVRPNGNIKWNARETYVSAALSGKYIALECLNKDHYRVYFMATLLGYYDPRSNRLKQRSAEKPQDKNSP